MTQDMAIDIEIINSASITIPEDLTTGTTAGDIDYLDFIDNLPTVSLAD